MSLLEALIVCFLFIDVGILIGSYYTDHLKIFAVCEVLGSLVCILCGILYSTVGLIIAGSTLLLWGIFCVWLAWMK